MKLKEIFKLKEAPFANKAADNLSKLYNSIIEMDDVDDEMLDVKMEKIVKKVGYTPEQNKIKTAYKFAYGNHPKFETLTDEQIRALETFLKSVQKKGYYY